MARIPRALGGSPAEVWPAGAGDEYELADHTDTNSLSQAARRQHDIVMMHQHALGLQVQLDRALTQLANSGARSNGDRHPRPQPANRAAPQGSPRRVGASAAVAEFEGVGGGLGAQEQARQLAEDQWAWNELTIAQRQLQDWFRDSGMLLRRAPAPLHGAQALDDQLAPTATLLQGIGHSMHGGQSVTSMEFASTTATSCSTDGGEDTEAERSADGLEGLHGLGDGAFRHDGAAMAASVPPPVWTGRTRRGVRHGGGPSALPNVANIIIRSNDPACDGRTLRRTWSAPLL